MQQTSVQKQKKSKIIGGFSMFKKMKHMKNEKGLTLIELLAVIVILAIVAAISIPAIGNIINNTRDKAVLSDVQSALAAAKIANADGSCEEPAATADATAGIAVGDVVCKPGQYEFKSGKFGETAVSSKIPNITVNFSKVGDVKITAVLAKDFSG